MNPKQSELNMLLIIRNHLEKDYKDSSYKHATGPMSGQENYSLDLIGEKIALVSLRIHQLEKELVSF